MLNLIRADFYKAIHGKSLESMFSYDDRMDILMCLCTKSNDWHEGIFGRYRSFCKLLGFFFLIITRLYFL